MILRKICLVLPAVAFATVPLAASAQSVDTGGGDVHVDLGTSGSGVHVDIHDGAAVDTQGGNVHVRAGDHQEVNVDRPGEAYKLTYDSDHRGRTMFKVLAPEGMHIKVTDGFVVLVDDRIPVSFRGRDGHFYRFRVWGRGGKVFDKKLEARGGRLARLWVRPSPAGAVHVSVSTSGAEVAPPPPAAAPPPPPAPAPAGCMGDADFASIRDHVKSEDFSDGKLAVLGDAVGSRAFCVSQVVSILGAFDFSGDKLKALRLMKDHIIDPENDYKIYKAFDFDSDKTKARKMLKR